MEHLKNGTVDLSSVTTVVIDEVDTMLDMGFLEDIEKTTLSISVKNINSIIGQNIEKIEIERILTSLEFEIKESVMIFY